MKLRTFLNIIGEIGGRVYGKLPEVSGELSFTIDSRKIDKNAVFYPIVGTRFNGHDFAISAVKAGAVGTVLHAKEVSEDVLNFLKTNNIFFVEVFEDTVLNLQKVAKSYRNRFAGEIVGITGSCGKTTTKGMISYLLEKFYKTYSSPGNYNNHIGLPLSIVNMPETAEFGVFETGINHPGEMDLLADILNPDYSVFTNAGASHLEGFGSVDVVVSEKLKLVYKTSKGVVINSAIPDIKNLLAPFAGRKIFVGKEDGDEYKVLKEGAKFLRFAHNGKEYEFSLKFLEGAHNHFDALLSVALCHDFNIPVQTLINEIVDFKGIDRRSEWLYLPDGTVILNDSYNANPISMKAALKLIEEKKKELNKKTVLIIGDMKELGENTGLLHEDIGKQICSAQPDILILVGDFARFYKKGALKCGFDKKRIFEFKDVFSLKDEIKKFVKGGELVLLKASRACELDRVIEFIRQG